ncbi:DNA-binding WRKY transcription factor [Tanacetum coccineum]
MSHQQVLAHVMAPAAQLQPIPTTHHHVPPPMPDHNVTIMAPELSESSSHSHPLLVAAEKPAEDGYNWRKYGQKQVKGNGLVTEIISKGKHNHHPPGIVGNINDTEPFNDQTSYFNYSRENPSIIMDQESSHEMSGSWDNDDVPNIKQKREAKGFDPVTSYGTRDSRIVVQATSKIDLSYPHEKDRVIGFVPADMVVVREMSSAQTCLFVIHDSIQRSAHSINDPHDVHRELQQTKRPHISKKFRALGGGLSRQDSRGEASYTAKKQQKLEVDLDKGVSCWSEAEFGSYKG